MFLTIISTPGLGENDNISIFDIFKKFWVCAFGQFSSGQMNQ